MFGKHIKENRKKQGISQKQLAEKLGVKQAYISMIETDKKNISLRKLEQIGTILGLSIEINNGKA